MKKLFILIPTMLLFLTGCGDKEGTINCKLSSKDAINGYQLEADYNIHYKGDYVEYVENKEIYSSDSESILNAFETQLNDTYGPMNETYGGYTVNISNENGKVTSNVKVDYTKMDLEKLVQDQPAMKIYIKDNKMSKEGLQATYEAMGATCK